ncbi:MAG: MFS transporter [Dehalococcoidales bacterium]|nr:MFS transporter [Dehalococcoidales bacterium]
MVGAAFVIQILTWGIYNSYGVFFSALEGEFGWSRAVIAGAASSSQFLMGVGAVFLGRLNDRFGPRVLMVYVGVMVGVGYFMMSQVDSIWMLFLFQGFIIGIGISGTDVILLSTTARWFVRRRGLMSGIVKTGTGVGFLVAPLVITWLISNHGWRNTYEVVGITLFVGVILIAQVLRRDPARMGLLPDGDKVQKPEDIVTAESGSTLREAARTRQFWMLCLMFFSVFFCTMSVIVHFAPSVVDLGQTTAVGAAMISIIGGASIAGRFIMGVANDRIGSRRATVVCLVIFAASFAWLQAAREPWALGVFAVAYGFCHGGFFTLVSPLVAEFFGMKAHGTILGIIVFCGGLGGTVGPFIIGNLYDAVGDYRASFWLLLGLAATGLTAIVVSGRGKSEN